MPSVAMIFRCLRAHAWSTGNEVNEVEFLIVVGIIVFIVLFFAIKSAIWDTPQLEIQRLQRDIEVLQKRHAEELSQLQVRLQNSQSLRVQENEFGDIIAYFAWMELSELCNKEYAFLRIPTTETSSYSYTFHRNEEQVKECVKKRFQDAIDEQYRYRYLIYLYPELEKVFDGKKVLPHKGDQPTTIELRSKNVFEVVNLLDDKKNVSSELILLKNRLSFLEASKSNLTAIPYMAAIMADYETYGLENLASGLDWGYDQRRMSKVKSIREIRKDAQAIVEKNKDAQYQLAYLIKLFPMLEDVIDAEFNQLPVIEVSELSDRDSVKDYLSKEEYALLSESDRNQLALDRYKKSHNRTKWQVGRDYELYVGYKYSQKGYKIDYFGSYMGLEDLGRDLIAKKGDEVLIIQCKYWSSRKEIHENHINQLYGTMSCYCIENKVDKNRVKGILITNIELSTMAKKMADYLDIKYVENFELGDYPCIKCNINRDEYGIKTKIYHLPFDQKYDVTKIDGNGEFMAMTVAEAEKAGFRRAHKWYGHGE